MRVKQRFYRPARNLYQRLLNREHFEERRRRREHFRPFVRRGELVFDVGANRGHYAERPFRELGARVVAIEPNASAAGAITRHFPGITVVQKAVGARPETAPLRLGATTSTRLSPTSGPRPIPSGGTTQSRSS